MKILTTWLRSYLPDLTVSDQQLADDLTLRGIAVDGVFDLGPDNGSLFGNGHHHQPRRCHEPLRHRARSCCHL